MRNAVLLGGGMMALILSGMAVAAPPARNTPQDIICAMTESCGTAATAGDDGRIAVGSEKAFSLAKPTSAHPPVAAAAPAFGTASRARANRAGNPRRLASATPRSVRRAAPSLDMLVTFDTGSAVMTEQARAEAQAFAKAMGSPQLADMRFTIEGHTDAVGNRDYNQALSQRRAQSVVDYLVSQGVSSGRLEARGYGFDRPRNGLSPRAPGNRRVEFVKQS